MEAWQEVGVERIGITSTLKHRRIAKLIEKKSGFIPTRSA